MSKILSPKSALYLVLTIVSLILWLENAVIQHSSAFKLLVLVAVLELGFLLFCRLKRWYGKEYVGLGIEDHFFKIMIPASSLSLLGSLWALFLPGKFFALIVLDLLLGFFVYVNMTLIGYHKKDPDDAPPAYFAAELYLKQK